MKIALVRHVVGDSGGGPSDDELRSVAAALQAQIVADAAPIWGISAVVSSFSGAEAVPAGHLPVVVVAGRRLPAKRRAFHLMAGGQSAALVEYGDDWTVGASHELIEMLCDPMGTRTIPGPSLVDELQASGAAEARDHEPQGLVEYLMEVCDPCEGSTYAIDGIRVSDFVTPQFYGLPSQSGNRYSFRGALTAPLGLNAGGYITWRTERGDVWQAYAPDDQQGGDVSLGRLQIKRLSERPLTLSRQWIDAHPEGIQRAADDPSDPSTGKTLPSYGQALQQEIGLRLDSPRFWRDVDNNQQARSFLGWLPHR